MTDKLEEWRKLCLKCCLALGAKPAPWPVTVSEGVCDRCGIKTFMASKSDYNWPDGRKAVWD